MSITTYEHTYGSAPPVQDAYLMLADGRRIPVERIGGVAEVKALLDQRGTFATTYPLEQGGVPRERISAWAHRWRTTEFPRALPIRVERGLLWDLAEVAQWQGPPGRWRQVDCSTPLEVDQMMNDDAVKQARGT